MRAFTSLQVLALLAILCSTPMVTAKRGCSAFGHSCYGGHGKRSGDRPMEDMSKSEDNTYQRSFGQEEIPPQPGYPRSEVLPSGENIIPVRDGGLYVGDESGEKRAMKQILASRLRNIVKQWMDHRMAQQGSDVSYE